MKTFSHALQKGRLYLREKSIMDADNDAWYLLSFCFNISRSYYLIHGETQITEEQYNKYMGLIKRRGNHIPLQYITGEQEFMGLNFLVSEEVLIPRQDTESLVEEVLKVSKDKEVLDLCTGTGCIIISLSKLGEIKQGVGVDISEGALAIARQNATKLNADVQFIKSDLYENIKNKFDIIVSNPPYIPTKVIEELMEEVKDHEPILALDGKEDGLYFYKRIINGLNSHLRPNGYVFFEIGYDQGDAVENLLKSHGFTHIKVIKDLAGLNRVVSGRLKSAEEPFT